MDQSTVGELTLNELEGLIRDIVLQTLSEVLPDPDAGLELNDDFRAELVKTLEAVRAGCETIPAEEVAASLGLSW